MRQAYDYDTCYAGAGCLSMLGMSQLQQGLAESVQQEVWKQVHLIR